jgi:hypothetical protein
MAGAGIVIEEADLKKTKPDRAGEGSVRGRPTARCAAATAGRARVKKASMNCEELATLCLRAGR